MITWKPISPISWQRNPNINRTKSIVYTSKLNKFILCISKKPDISYRLAISKILLQ